MSWPKGRSRRAYNASHPHGSNSKIKGKPDKLALALTQTQMHARALEALEKTNQINRERPWTSKVFPYLSIDDQEEIAVAAKQILDEMAGPGAKETILYRHFNKNNQLLYVGISISVMVRLQKHSTVPPWWRNISHITFERFSCRAAAIAAEQMAIEKEKPLHNIMGKTTDIIAEEIEWSEPWNTEDSKQWQYLPY
jgi:hypothetical protein